MIEDEKDGAGTDLQKLCQGFYSGLLNFCGVALEGDLPWKCSGNMNRGGKTFQQVSVKTRHLVVSSKVTDWHPGLHDVH